MTDKLSNGLAKADDLTNNLANNLTNNEIIEFLKCCAYSEGCENCPYSKKCDGTEHIIQAIDLIKRQKAEIEQWKEEANKYQSLWASDCTEAKSEAIREFAERLKEKAKPHYFDNCNFAVPIDDIDNLVKEMAGDTDER